MFPRITGGPCRYLLTCDSFSSDQVKTSINHFTWNNQTLPSHVNQLPEKRRGMFPLSLSSAWQLRFELCSVCKQSPAGPADSHTPRCECHQLPYLHKQAALGEITRNITSIRSEKKTLLNWAIADESLELLIFNAFVWLRWQFVFSSFL